METEEKIINDLDKLNQSLIYIRDICREYLRNKYGNDLNLAYTPFNKEDTEINYIRLIAVDSNFSTEDSINDISTKDYTNINNGKLPCVIVKFPYLNILNSNGASHNITDLYALIILNYNCTLRDIKCVRSTLTKSEYYCGYIFSHANSDRLSVFGRFASLCFGSGEIADYRDALFHKDVLNNKALWGMLPDNLFRYFSWESLEGRPWKEFSNIGSNRKINFEMPPLYGCIEHSAGGTYSNSICTQCKNLLMEFINKNYKQILSNIPISYKDGRYYISKSNYSEIWYNIAILAKGKPILEKFNMKHNCDLHLYSYTSNQLFEYNEGDEGVLSSRMFKFNGAIIYSRVLNDALDYKIIKSFHINTFAYIIYLINKRLNKNGEKHILR